ncbi:MAG TPA: flagellar biosynthesis anti-sigma factor FlgM [Candidatus Acidoferrum sp.]|jgi:flagellar biosynthesis anti-sigma factor FlgM
MKIDPTIQFPSDPQSDRVTNAPGKATLPQRSSSSAGTSSPTGEDTFSPSSTHDQVQSLTAGLASVPEVRTQLVAALQQRVNSGTYQPSSQKVADAIIADQAGRKL